MQCQKWWLMMWWCMLLLHLRCSAVSQHDWWASFACRWSTSWCSRLGLWVCDCRWGCWTLSTECFRRESTCDDRRASCFAWWQPTQSPCKWPYIYIHHHKAWWNTMLYDTQRCIMIHDRIQRCQIKQINVDESTRWLNDWMRVHFITQQMNECTNAWTNQENIEKKQMTTVWMKEWMNEAMSEWLREWTIKRCVEWMVLYLKGFAGISRGR
jgi:hypothetical protein